MALPHHRVEADIARSSSIEAGTGGLLQTLLDARVIIAGALGVFLSQLYVQRFFLHDDALISLRFARNFVQAGALEWNLGERVEGYTNFLHLVATAGLMTLGIDPIAAACVINALSAAALFAAVWFGLKRLLPAGGSSLLPAVAIALLASTGPLAVWIYGGLETVMATALVTSGLIAVLMAVDDDGAAAHRQPEKILAVGGVLLGCAVLTRPDAAAATAATCLGLLLFVPRPLVRRFELAVWLAAPAVLIVLAHAAWRFAYYDDFLPNTFYAKVSISPLLRLPNGALYVVGSLLQVPAVPLALILGLLAARGGRLSPRMCVLALVLVVHVLSIVWAGGDHMPGARMLLPSIGPAVLLIALALSASPVLDHDRLIGLTLGLGFVCGVLFPQEKMDKAAYYGSMVGQHLAKTEKPGTLVALSGAGATPYYAHDLVFIDMLGLIDRTIARRQDVPMLLPWQYTPGHAKGDGAYVLSRKPDIIILGPPSGVEASTPWFLSDLEISKHPEFARCYRLVTTPLSASAEHLRAAPRIHFQPVPFHHYRRHCRD